MAKLTVITREGAEVAVVAEDGISVLEATRLGGVDEIAALCGGSCSCATCHVYVDPLNFSKLEPMSGDEDDLLDGSAHRSDTSRLSCQIRLSDAVSDLRITIAPDD